MHTKANGMPEITAVIIKGLRNPPIFN